jgi:hypothetical protein
MYYIHFKYTKYCMAKLIQEQAKNYNRNTISSISIFITIIIWTFINIKILLKNII